MPNDHIKDMQRQIADLQKQVADLRRDLGRESQDTTTHIKKIHQYIVDINDYLWPVVRKVFPNYAKDLRAIDRFTKGGPSRTGDPSTP
jgi:predicted  nucleic acid-binding Zn-ribbon protein